MRPVRWSFGGGVRYADARQADEAKSLELPSYVVVDLSAGADLRLGGRAVSLDLGLRNAFDRDYYPSADGASRVMIGEPRRLEARVRVDI